MNATALRTGAGVRHLVTGHIYLFRFFRVGTKPHLYVYMRPRYVSYEGNLYFRYIVLFVWLISRGKTYCWLILL